MRYVPRTSRQRGFTLIESMVSLAVTGFGMLALAGMQSTLSRNADIAKQRTEAVRLAQAKLESLRSYTAIASNGGNAWNDLPASGVTTADQIAPGGNYADGTPVVGNTVFYRNWQVAGNLSDAMRTATVTVAWTDRGAASTSAADRQSISLSTVISKTDPAAVGALGFPLPGNTNLKRPKNRHLSIPVPAVDIGGGKSAYQLTNNLTVVLNNDSGQVMQKCGFTVAAGSNLSGCTAYDAYIVTGYVSRSSTSIAWPTGLNTSGLNNGTAGAIDCVYGQAVDQNSSGTTLGNYKYYLCVVPVASGGDWSGKMLLSGLSTTGQVIACRFQYADDGSSTANERNVQPYATVKAALDNQNYVVTTSNASGTAVACPTVAGLATTLHQDCRGIAHSANTASALLSNCPVAIALAP